MMSDEFVRVQVPATTANLGPGFDCLGIALGLHNVVELRTSAEPVVEICGEGAETLPRDATNLTYLAAQRVAAKAGYEGHWHVRQKNRIPLARGLGSSSAAIVGGIAAAQQALGYEMECLEALALAVDMEGHPDNVAPALLGGLTVCFEQADGAKVALGLEAPVGLMAVVAIPDFEVSTAAARKVLPEQVPFGDAVFNTGQAAAVVAMLASGRYEGLAEAMRDRLHQPYRAYLVAGMDELIRAAIDADAKGAALSGSGPTIVALAERDNCQRVETAMLAAGRGTGRKWASRVLAFDNDGVSIVE